MLKKCMFLPLITFMILFTGCADILTTPEENRGQVRFSFTETDTRAANLTDARSLLITITDELGNFIYNQKTFELKNIGGKLITDPLFLNTGNYLLKEYAVLNQDNKAIYAAPRVGSELAQIVQTPLDMAFSIAKGIVTTLNPEVIDVTAVPADDFGYTGFTFTEVKTFPFTAAVMELDETTTSYIHTSAVMTITAAGKAYTYSFTGSVKNIQIVDMDTSYSVEITKVGYSTWSGIYTNQEMKQFSVTPLVASLVKEVMPLPVAEYLFNGSAVDTSGNGLNGTVYGATLTSDRFGNADSAYYFRGTYVFSGQRADHIRIADNPLLESSNVKTITAWINKTGDNAGSGQNHTVISKYRTETPAESGYLMKYVQGQASIFYKDQMTGAVVSPVYGNGQWVFIASSWDPEAGTMTLYVNGEKTGTMAINAPADDPANDIFIGACSGADAGIFTMNSPFYGSIDDIRFYDRPLTESQIKSLYKK